MKTIGEMFNCVHPLIFEHDCAEFRYSMLGAGFLVRFEHHLFFVTALHCFGNQEVIPEQVRIKSHSGCKEVIRFDRQYSGRSLFPDDPDRADLIILHANIEHTPAEVLEGISPFPLSASTCCAPGTPDLHYRICGYPASLCGVDYDTLSITGRIAFPSLQHAEPGTGIAHVHCFTYPTHECEDPNGLSGSPVFGISALDPKHSLMQLVGLVIRGGNGNLYAIDGRLVADAVCDAARQEDERDRTPHL
jgi:hypothetical protein